MYTRVIFFASYYVGIEILETLHAQSLELLERWQSADFQRALPEAARAVPVAFVLGDVTKVDWSDADVIFANSTCFDEALMREIAAGADGMRVGSFAVTFSKRIPSHKWTVREKCVASECAMES